MKKVISYILFVLLFSSCDKLDLLKSKKTEVKNEPIIASVGEINLYLSDVGNAIPKNIPSKDSIILIKSFINSWAKKQLLLLKAKKNISDVSNKEVDLLVKNYREGLYINGYKESLINQQLDTVISDIEIKKYYLSNKDNFRLNEELLQMKFIYFGKDFLDKEEAIKKFKSNSEEDLEVLENLTINFKDYKLRDSTWLTYDKFLLKIPPFRYTSREKLLKKSKFIQKEDSLGVYLVAVNKILKRNEVAPLSYIQNNIKQLILHKRKIELVREIEKTLINDAIKNNEFKEY